ncbi:hypothetical protein CYLTODRAFT_160218 [Cylindrobasidium torrendii FP15055 ss-10]|uniref:Secreted protein n=1 Tax=Cylindrobasidium torrendii FP15055 ss-10 TaxID=1314674 RepID=A0A0D7AY40_9AGAR|nr:hypothetical protein CYLTODRAFT_160218 [Cylindrobasidium torrendii FP15055 ss-10]
MPCSHTRTLVLPGLAHALVFPCFPASCRRHRGRYSLVLPPTRRRCMWFRAHPWIMQLYEPVLICCAHRLPTWMAVALSRPITPFELFFLGRPTCVFRSSGHPLVDLPTSIVRWSAQRPERDSSDSTVSQTETLALSTIPSYRSPDGVSRRSRAASTSLKIED